jgi:prophage tail gpP-like protein
MAYFDSTGGGRFDDRVRIELGGDPVRIIEDYDVNIGVLDQPAGFSLRLGSGEVARKLIKAYPPRTPFRLYIGDVLQQTGWTDGAPESNASGSSGTSLSIRGRDTIGQLLGMVANEVSLSDETYTSLVEKIVEVAFQSAEAILGNARPKVIGSNAAARKIRAGVPIVELAPPRLIEEILLGTPSGANPTVGTAHVTQQTKLSETYISVIRRYLDRAGLMIWAAPDGNYILSRPNADQKPTYRIARARGGTARAGEAGAGQVVGHSYRNDTVSRYSHAIIYGRGGGKKAGRAKSRGAETDDEMVSWGFYKPLVVRDANVSNTEQASYLAARKLAEARRHGWVLEYTVSGHTTPSLVGGGRAVWTPDTVVTIEDDELGLHGDYYLERVDFRRGPETTTRLKLMRPMDLIFGGDQ